MNRTLLIIVGILVAIGLYFGAVWAFSDKPGTYGEQPAATTTPEVPATGTSTPTPEQESDTAALNQRIYKFGVHITPLEVVEDSRCPMGVQCIQAGTVRLKAKLEDGTRTETVTFDIGSPVSFGTKHIALMSVLPVKTQAPMKLSDYRFVFSVAYGMGGDAP